ncbi:hypothetical protein HDF10_001043 [Edaphobacter lichenicola]|uniref:Uncharacterized protein n=1 Tax=Tunturiibacter lichenicola TaxID=2051959 RepID=A0A7W8J5T7_9BACT|nr:hypothetical protein [Edaphobacter lichenicola]
MCAPRSGRLTPLPLQHLPLRQTNLDPLASNRLRSCKSNRQSMHPTPHEPTATFQQRPPS